MNTLFQKTCQHCNSIIQTKQPQQYTMFPLIEKQYLQTMQTQQSQQNNNSSSSLSIDNNFILRKNIHNLKTQNYTLKQQLTIQRQQILNLQTENSELKRQYSDSLKEMHKYDHEIEHLKTANQKLKQYGGFLEIKVDQLTEEVEQLRVMSAEREDYDANLNVQNQLLIQMKKQLTEDNTKLTNKLDVISEDYLVMQQKVKGLELELGQLLKQSSTLKIMLAQKDQDIKSYEDFLNKKTAQFQSEKINAIQEEFDHCLIMKKLDKYRKKAIKYKQQRDFLHHQIEIAKQQIGSISLRKYYNTDENQCSC